MCWSPAFQSGEGPVSHPNVPNELSTAFWRYAVSSGRRSDASRALRTFSAQVFWKLNLLLRDRRVGQLRVVVVEDRLVRREAAAQRVGIRCGRRRRALRRLQEEIDDADLDVLAAVAAPEPQFVLRDRSAHLKPEVVDVLDRVARAGALRPQLVGHVVRLELVVRVVEAARALEHVRPRAGDEVDPDAAGLHGSIRPAGGHLHFLEHVEVVVDRRGARRGHVRDVDAVDVPLVVARAGAARDVARLLARLVAADVHAVHRDRGRPLEHDPGVARRRDVLERLEVERRPVARVLDVDDGALTRHRHGLLDRGDLELSVHLRIEPDRDAHILADQRLEAGQLELHGVGADRHPRELVGSRLRRDGCQCVDQHGARDRHRDAGEHGPGSVRHAAGDVADV